MGLMHLNTILVFGNSVFSHWPCWYRVALNKGQLRQVLGQWADRYVQELNNPLTPDPSWPARKALEQRQIKPLTEDIA